MKILALLLLLSACHAPQAPVASVNPVSSAEPLPPGLMQKPILRACEQACPEVHDPVCATVRQYGRTYSQTFSNSCFACVPDGEILSLQKGACGTLQMR